MAGEAPELSAQERAGKAFPVSWDQFHRDCRALKSSASNALQGMIIPSPARG